MKTTVFLLLLLLSASMSRGQDVNAGHKDDMEVDLPAMYDKVDDAISQAERYITDYSSKLLDIRRRAEDCSDPGQRLMLTMQLSDMYESFNGDSSLVYALRAMQQAEALGYTDTAADMRARMAYLCTFLGSQTESLTILGQIDKSALSHDGLCYYYRSYMMVYGNLGGNCQIPSMRDEFYRIHHLYMDSLLATATPGSELYLGHIQPQLVEAGKYEEALKVNDERMNTTQEGTHENAIICYSRYTIYQAMGNSEMAKYWLCRSALDDIRNAVLDQASLLSLADMLNAEGDLERANRYISFTWECNRRYSPRMRSWQIAPLLSAIEGNFQSKLDRKSRFLTLTSVCLGVLAFLFIACAFYFSSRLKALTKANTALEAENKKLSGTNDILRALQQRAAIDAGSAH